jgi:prespore-specific regulator
MKERKDLWKPEEDQLLEETVLEYTSNGDSKASAFKKASTKLGRTVSACQYRWNMVITKREECGSEEISKNTAGIQNHETPGTVPPANLAQVIHFLRNFAKTQPDPEQMKENKWLHEEQVQLKLQNEQLIKRLKEKEMEYKNQLLQYEEMASILKEADQLLKHDSIEENRAVH